MKGKYHVLFVGLGIVFSMACLIVLGTAWFQLREPYITMKSCAVLDEATKTVMKASCATMSGEEAKCVQAINAYACPGGIDVSGNSATDSSGNTTK